MTAPGDDPLGWLETASTRRTSDIALGAVLLIAGGLALWLGTDYAMGTMRRLGPRAFPAAVATLLCVVAIVLLLRAALGRSPGVRRSHPIFIAVVAAIIILVYLAGQTAGKDILLRFGPAEFLSLLALELALAVALAHSSRLRAGGMALFGLLLCTVGTDVNSGVLRFTMGIEGLTDGISVAILLVGLFAAGDALVCIGSPLLFLRTYTRLVTSWLAKRMPIGVDLAMRLVAAGALAGAVYFAYSLSHSYADAFSLVIFGAFGAAGKILGWNRFLLFMGFSFGLMLEENIRRALLLTRGDLLPILERPISGAVFVAIGVVLAAALVHSGIRAARETRHRD